MDGGSVAKHLLRYFSSKYGFYSGSSYVVSTTTVDTNKFIILNVELNNGNANLFINNILESSGFSGNNSSGGLTLGSLANGFNNTQLIIPEIFAFNDTITDSLRTILYNYLHYKYAPPINLGANIYAPNFCDTVLYAGKRFTNHQWQDNSNSDSLIITETGWYSVTATDIFGFQSTDSIFVQFPTINQLTNNTICQGNSILWNTNLSNSTYNFEWNDSSTDSSLTISQPGDYWVKVTDSLGCFKYSDTITIAIDSFPTQTTLGIDKTVCQGATIGLEVGNNVVSYLWNTNDTTAQITIDTAGTYWVQVQNNVGCVASDTIQITVNGIAPTVIFNAINACNNSPTLFNNTSFTTDGSNIISSFWTFGTGDTSNLQNPSYYYLATGNYTVTLQIITDSGCTNTLTQQIQVHKKPTAGFFPANSLMCSEQNSFFTNNSFSSDGVINSWLWDFGVAGNTDTSSLQNGNYAYAIAGNYSVQLIVTTEFGCRDTALNLINIKPSPTANFIVQDSCLTNQTKFTNLSTGTISMTNWDFGDANSSALLNPSHVYANSGSYNVILAIKATNGCWDTLIKPLNIYDNPMANFVTDDYCVLSNNQLFDSSSTNAGSLTNWSWNIASLSFQSTNQNPNIIFNLADSGTYQVKLNVVNSFGCTDSITKTIVVYPLPVANFNFSPEIGLPPLLVNFNNQTYGANSYLWDFGDGNSSIATSPTYTFQDSGIFNVTLFTTSLYGCVDSISKTIQIIEPIIDIAVKNIYYEFVPNTNFMKISVQLGNEGRVTIKNMDLILQNSSTVTILETWSGNLAPNLQNIYTFSSMIEMPNGEIPSLICVTATNINRGIDANLSNNEFCKALNKFELINIYPNPTSKDLFLEFISPDVSTLEINLFDNTGNLVSNLFSGQSSKGINRKSFVMSIYSQGLYIIEIKNQEEIIRKKLVIE
jgi:PKD repeat protein